KEIGGVGAAIGDPVERRVSAGALAEAYLAAGRAGEALPLARAYLEQRRRFGAHGFGAGAPKLVGGVPPGQTPPPDAEADTVYRQAQERARGLGMRPLEAVSGLQLGRLLLSAGRRTEAVEAFDEAEKRFRAMRLDTWVSRVAAARRSPA